MKVNVDKINFEIKRLGLTQEGFAEEAKITRQTLFSIRKGADCRMETITQIAKALRIPANELIIP